MTVMEIHGRISWPWRPTVTCGWEDTIGTSGWWIGSRKSSFASTVSIPVKNPTPADVWRNCEDAKRTLSAHRKTSIACLFQGRSVRVEVSREKFEEITRDLLDRTSFTTRQTLQAAGLEWKDIDHVLLVGGSTRMPAVREMLQDLSGKAPDHSVSPDEAVAHGAALHAGLLIDRHQGKSPSFRMRNVNSHSSESWPPSRDQAPAQRHSDSAQYTPSGQRQADLPHAEGVPKIDSRPRRGRGKRLPRRMLPNRQVLRAGLAPELAHADANRSHVPLRGQRPTHGRRWTSPENTSRTSSSEKTASPRNNSTAGGSSSPDCRLYPQKKRNRRTTAEEEGRQKIRRREKREGRKRKDSKEVRQTQCANHVDSLRFGIPSALCCLPLSTHLPTQKVTP